MKMDVHVTSMYETNTYILVSEAKNAVIIDPAEIGKSVIDALVQDGIKVTKILLTHGHFDHTKACAEIVRTCGDVTVYIHKGDAEKLSDVNLAMGSLFTKKGFEPLTQYTTVDEGDKIVQDELEFTVWHTPGHTAGSVIYQLGDILFTGDTLFKETIGATHDTTADINALLNSVERLKATVQDFRVLPGHSEETTLSYEKKNNPYMNS
ncbi:MAG: MBL fold metallo-hydrolase [Oscillospiraceae bacterium]|nr:MBL fold metallo-hydrolase [Oscillospiraceae bacterium]